MFFFKSSDAVPDIPSTIPTSKTNIVISIYNDVYDGVDKLTAVKDDAEQFQTLLKEKFGYEVPFQTFFQKTGLENIATGEKLVKVLEALLKRWQANQPVGETLGRFILYRVFFYWSPPLSVHKTLHRS